MHELRQHQRLQLNHCVGADAAAVGGGGSASWFVRPSV
jgi:hypothetical protein